MKVYANRYGLIESTELAFALCAEEERRRVLAARRAEQAARRAVRRERARSALLALARGVVALRAALVPPAIGRARG